MPQRQRISDIQVRFYEQQIADVQASFEAFRKREALMREFQEWIDARAWAQPWKRDDNATTNK